MRCSRGSDSLASRVIWALQFLLVERTLSSAIESPIAFVYWSLMHLSQTQATKVYPQFLADHSRLHLSGAERLGWTQSSIEGQASPVKGGAWSLLQANGIREGIPCRLQRSLMAELRSSDVVYWVGARPRPVHHSGLSWHVRG